MALNSGTRLGSYEIVALLGAGGMGEVYRARDTKLGREVAIKVLPEAWAFDADRAARFEREAQVLASLNHPHIATLYGTDQSDGRHFLVMELVEGETLAERLQRGPLPVEDALTIAHQIAEALEAAHEKGIVHRDLKPANVKITPNDQVKVLDFGLAKAMDPVAQGFSPAANLTNSPTLSMMATQAGVILGTAAYMSPEQAQGLAADPRSDVFSFGSVLYEMLTGRQPFQGDTAAAILASVLVREPDLARAAAESQSADCTSCCGDVWRKIRSGAGRRSAICARRSKRSRRLRAACPRSTRSSRSLNRCGDARFPCWSLQSSRARSLASPCGASDRPLRRRAFHVSRSRFRKAR